MSLFVVSISERAELYYTSYFDCAYSSYYVVETVCSDNTPYVLTNLLSYICMLSLASAIDSYCASWGGGVRGKVRVGVGGCPCYFDCHLACLIFAPAGLGWHDLHC